MFRKLVSNLPFSPALVNELGFYSKRLRKEQATRKIALIVTALALVVQSLTFLAPAKASLAASANDIVFGGGDRQELVRALSTGCDRQGRCDLPAIYGAYGITKESLANAQVETIYSSIANNYWSIGRSPRGHCTQLPQYCGEVSHRIPGGPVIYARTLHGWAANKGWEALRVQTPQGTRWVLTDCGNIVTKETTPVEPPDVTTTKSVDKSTVNKGDKVTFTIVYKNIGKGLAKNVLLYDDAPDGIELLNEGMGNDPIKSPRRWETHKRFDIASGQSYTYRINARVTKAGPTTLTNKACADIFDTNIYNNCDEAPVTVNPPCPIPGKEHLPKDDPQCKTNPALLIEKTSDKAKLKLNDAFAYKLKVTNKGDVDLPRVVVRDVAPEQIEFLEAKQPGDANFKPVTNKRDFISREFKLKKKQSVEFEIKAKVIKNTTKPVVNQACVLSVGATTTAGSCDETPVTITELCATNPALPKDDKNCQPSCPIPGKEGLPQNSPDCKPCDESKQTTDGKDISCLELHKSAKNITQQIDNANGTTAKAGDTIEYTLSVKNQAKQTRKGFVIEENMHDVMEYAELIDASGATFTQTPISMLTWAPVDIKPGETVKRTVLVKIKSSIPNTPASTSDPLSYDMKLVNVYGDTVRIDLPQNPIKVVEQTVRVLPSTGLGSNMIISTLLIAGATYFYYRSRLLVKEVGLVRQQFNYGAGA